MQKKKGNARLVKQIAKTLNKPERTEYIRIFEGMYPSCL